MFRFVFIALVFSFNYATAQYSKSVSIPLKTVKKPAADLVGKNGDVLDVGEASQMAEQGFDLSLLNPQDNRMWQNQKYPAFEETQDFFPTPEMGVLYESTESKRVEVFSHQSRVVSKVNGQHFYRMTISRLSHNTLMRAVLLRKLGYYVPTPRYYKKLKVQFASEEQKEAFIAEVEEEGVIADLRHRNWILEDDTKNHSLVLADLLLEVANPDYYDIANGSAPDPIFARSTVARLSRHRAYRALILPYALLDIPESINRYSPKLGSIMAGHIIFTYPYAPSFAAATIEDLRWVARRILQLTEADWREVVAAGEFPSELNELIYAKLIHRVRNAAELVDLNSDFKLQLPNLFVNSSSDLVKDGKVTRENVPGYPIRFAHGDREAPFKDGDFARYLGIRGRTSVLATLIGELNKKLQILSVDDALADRRMDIQNRIINHIRNNPDKPLYQKVEAWGGPLFGFNVAATRNVSTGTYYDSTAPIQLVDNMSVGVQLGYFMALDGVPKKLPMGGANLILSRDYTHVRPITSLQEGKNVSWKNLVIPHFMNSMAKMLEEEKSEVEIDGAKVDRYSVDKFLSELRTGEVFIITDSVVTSAYAQVSAGLDALLGISPLNFMNSVSLGTDANRVVLRQTSIVRTPNGIQVFVRHQKNQIYGLTFDINYFINLLRIRAQTQEADLNTDAFVIKYEPGLSADVDSGSATGDAAGKFEETRENLRPALLNLFRDNNPQGFYSLFEYQKFNIDHTFKTKELRSKFLWWRMNEFQEDHWARILYPRSEEAPELDPEDEKVVLFGHKKGELVGRDLLGLTLDLIQGWINRKSKVDVNLGGTPDPNPANTPFGKAYWRIATTEGDFSPNGDRYPNVAILSHVWGGWNLDRKEFFRLLDDISNQFKNTKIGSYRLIEPEAFMNVKSVDFYRINSMVSILPGGIAKIKELILQPEAANKKIPKASLLSRLFQKISQKIGDGARPQEKEMYDEIIRILGNDNIKVGQEIFRQACQENQIYQEGGPTYTGVWRNGNFYDCLTPWMEKLMSLSTKFPHNDEVNQVRWTTEVLYILDQYIPMAQLLEYLGEENFIFTVRINGFRTGDEDADLEYFSNTIGDPKENIEFANGLFQMYANKTGIMPIEIDRSLGSFK